MVKFTDIQLGGQDGHRGTGLTEHEQLRCSDLTPCHKKTLNNEGNFDCDYRCETNHVRKGAAVANGARLPAGSPPDFHKWESCRTMPLIGGSSRGYPASPAPSFRRRFIITSITLIGYQDLAVKSCQNLFTSRYNAQFNVYSVQHECAFTHAWLHHCGPKLEPRSDLRSTQKTVASFEFRYALEIEMKFISIRRNWRFKISIRDQQPSSTNANHELSLAQHSYIETKIKLDPVSNLGSFDLGSGRKDVGATGPQSYITRTGFNPRAGSPDFRKWESCRPDDAVDRRVFSGISRSPRPFIPASLHIHFNHSHWLSRPRLLRSAQNLFTHITHGLELQFQAQERGSDKGDNKQLSYRPGASTRNPANTTCRQIVDPIPAGRLTFAETGVCLTSSTPHVRWAGLLVCKYGRRGAAAFPSLVRHLDYVTPASQSRTTRASLPGLQIPTDEMMSLQVHTLAHSMKHVFHKPATTLLPVLESQMSPPATDSRNIGMAETWNNNGSHVWLPHRVESLTGRILRPLPCPHSSGVVWLTFGRRVAGSRLGASDAADFQFACRTSRALGPAVAGRLDCSPPYRCELGSTPGRVAPGFLQVGIVADDAACRLVFSGISRFPTALEFRRYLISPASALKTSSLRAAIISQLQLGRAFKRYLRVTGEARTVASRPLDACHDKAIGILATPILGRRECLG
ncbi:hypothetical protein PR048_033676 [Dryococelus australis]|uniref:Uncharacterized protein n=1 Tax=Dryococelus australis TaxID=614101 RepID=A0ABQ9G0Z3_9NEOP|nr:hypothetical protein PR048_033676 [Dryococelus australis]